MSDGVLSAPTAESADGRGVTAPSARRPAKPFRPGMLVNARLLRLLIGLGFVIAAAWYIYLYAFNKVSIAGVVNAPLVTVVSQIDGRIGAVALAQGASVGAGSALATVTNERVDNRTAVDLARSLEADRERLAALRRDAEELTALRADLDRRARDFQIATVDRLEHSLKETEASLASARVVERQTSDQMKRGAFLVERGAIAVAHFDDLTYAHRRAEVEVSRLEAALAGARRQLSAAKAGVFLGDNFADVPYSRQRLDEVDMRLAGLRNDERALLAAIAEREGELAAETERVAKLARQVLAAPVDGVVWRSNVTAGAEVVRGAPLFEVIDCNHVHVEATTRERFFETLAPGRRVRVRLEGSDADFPGTIRSVVGPGASLDRGPQLSVIGRRNGTEAQVIVDIDAGALPAAAGSMCNVGRSAKVYFE